MGRIPPRTPSAGGLTPLSPGEEGKSSSKSEVASFRSSEMSISTTSEDPKSTTVLESDNLTSKMWVSNEKNEFTDAATNAGIVNSLKNAFSQIPD